MKDGRIVLKAKINNISPLAIGSGLDTHTDRDIVTTFYHLDKDLNIIHADKISGEVYLKELPFIPATGFLGKIARLVDKETDPGLLSYWGESEKWASYIDCSDLFLSKIPDGYDLAKTNVIESRDGIRLNSVTGIVANGAKFDFQVFPPGAEFDLTIEFRISSGEDESNRGPGDYNTAYKLASLIKAHIESGFEVGAKTTNGFGLLKGKAQLFSLDFEDSDQFSCWIRNDFSNLKPIQVDNLPIESSDFTIKATFKIKNSLIIRSYSKDPALPDATHLKSGKNPILSGTSVKGALRARAERILNTIKSNSEDANSILTGLFGDVEKEDNKEIVKKDGYTIPSRIYVNEVIIENTTVREEIQTRIQIDRFTGGTVEGALLEEVPVFPIKGSLQVKDLTIRIVDPQPADKGLLLLLLKDLWTSDLPIGGEKAIGRGVLEGVSAVVFDGAMQYTLPEAFNNTEEMKILQSWVDVLNHETIDEYYTNRINKYKARKK